MTNILVLSYYFFPDLSAGSFRNTALVKELSAQLGNKGFVTVITTQPNRYNSFRDKAPDKELWGDNVKILRIGVPLHKSGFKDQISSYLVYYRKALQLIKGTNFNLVYASSSRLFTAYLGKVIAKKCNCPLFLDIRDIFVETMVDVLKNNPVVKYMLLKSIEFLIERPTFKKAIHINLVSKGFENYFRKITKSPLSFFPNGIDDAFLGLTAVTESCDKVKVITYAGNIGEGQGLEKIIPDCAELLGDNYIFKVIGDGGTRVLLEDNVRKRNLNNVEILKPMKRDELVEVYRNSHFLFLHLNNYKAFESVLPSKIFEYGATDLPMIAGVGGYAKQFISENVPNSFVFEPCDHIVLVKWLHNYKYVKFYRDNFVKSYKRDNITKNLVNCILSYIDLHPATGKCSLFVY